ncbi:unnamed protein product [Cuscuta epithymum]|uniref:Uncharacterized protein n=1 Tax=Cuscuta epithymum TaxID=186058 RepID=A0AAV0G8D5_9ASTE|nr:unnamed protein product [Cuscuta epithymum]
MEEMSAMRTKNVKSQIIHPSRAKVFPTARVELETDLPPCSDSMMELEIAVLPCAAVPTMLTSNPQCMRHLRSRTGGGRPLCYIIGEGGWANFAFSSLHFWVFFFFVTRNYSDLGLHRS